MNTRIIGNISFFTMVKAGVPRLRRLDYDTNACLTIRGELRLLQLTYAAETAVSASFCMETPRRPERSTPRAAVPDCVLHAGSCASVRDDTVGPW